MEAGLAGKVAALAAAVADLQSVEFSGLSPADLLDLCTATQRARNLLPTIEQPAITALTAQSTPAQIGAKSWPEVLRIRLRIPGVDAHHRVRNAQHLARRVALTGEPLPPVRPATAAAQAGGWVTEAHLEVLESFFRRCPAWVDDTERARFERKLAAVAARDTPETLRRTVDETLYLLNQDGPAPDDGKRRRGIHIGPQDVDGTSMLSGRISAELRAGLEAVFAKLAAPGMANPADEHPRVSGTPTDEQIQSDTRLPGQRAHDALWAMTRESLASGVWGQHNGLPVSIVITTTLAELLAGAGIAVTTTGTRLSIPQVIGLAATSHQYLAVFAEHTGVPLYLGRARRTATTGQRLMLFARDRGCTRPGCTASAERAQAHHARRDFALGGQTNIDELALGCGPDQRLVGPGKWRTWINAQGRCEWIPPPLLDTGQNRLNQHHHPHLTHNNDSDEGDEETDCQSA